MPWQGDLWSGMAIYLGPNRYIEIHIIAYADITEARKHNGKDILGMPVYASLNGDRLELYPTPDDSYRVVELPKHLLIHKETIGVAI